MTPLFAKDTEWLTLESVARSWIGTPYRHLQCVKGRGADCALFIGGCFLEAGYLTKISKPTYYPRDWALHAKDEYVLDGLYKNTRENLIPGLELIALPPGTPFMRGDWVALSTTRQGVKNHACIMLDDTRFIHAQERAGVRISGMDQPMRLHVPWHKMPRSAFRLMEVEEW